MTFVQLIEYRTQRYEELSALFDEWKERTQGRRTASHTTVCRDRDQDGVYVELVEFPSYESAMENSSLPETNEFAQRISELCEGGKVTFRNLEVMRSEDL